MSARKNNYPTQEELKQYFYYKDGKLIFKEREVKNGNDRQFNKRYAGKSAGTTKKDGYHHIKLNQRLFLRSNLVWIFHNGPIPQRKTIDHIHRVRTLDKIEGLRLADMVLQNINKKSYPADKIRKSNLIGVSTQVTKHGTYYRSTITVNKKRINIGSFKTEQEAHQAYMKAKKERDQLVINNQ